MKGWRNEALEAVRQLSISGLPVEQLDKLNNNNNNNNNNNIDEKAKGLPGNRAKIMWKTDVWVLR